MPTAFGSRGPIVARCGCVEESEPAISLLFSRGVRLFVGDVKLFRMVLAGDSDLERVRCLEVSLGIGKLPATKNLAGRLFPLSQWYPCWLRKKRARVRLKAVGQEPATPAFLRYFFGIGRHLELRLGASTVRLKKRS